MQTFVIEGNISKAIWVSSCLISCLVSSSLILQSHSTSVLVSEKENAFGMVDPIISQEEAGWAVSRQPHSCNTTWQQISTCFFKLPTCAGFNY